jgi:hypothetical protein
VIADAAHLSTGLAGRKGRNKGPALLPSIGDCSGRRKWAAVLISPAQILLLRVFFGFLPLAFVAWRRQVIGRR